MKYLLTLAINSISFCLFISGCQTAANTALPGQRPTPTPEKSVVHEYVVHPGRSLGLVSIRDSYTDVLQKFPMLEGTDTVTEASRLSIYGKDYDCPKNYHWIYKGNDLPGENYFYFDNENRVTRIATRSEKYRLANGLGVGSKFEEIRENFPVVKRYKLEFTPVNIHNETYLVDIAQGIAFQYMLESNDVAEVVTMVSLFEPNTEFVPWGCVTPPVKYGPDN